MTKPSSFFQPHWITSWTELQFLCPACLVSQHMEGEGAELRSLSPCLSHSDSPLSTSMLFCVALGSLNTFSFSRKNRISCWLQKSVWLLSLPCIIVPDYKWYLQERKYRIRPKALGKTNLCDTPQSLGPRLGTSLLPWLQQLLCFSSWCLLEPG